MADGSKVIFDWDHRNRLTTVTFTATDGTTVVKTVTYVYDTSDLRVAKLVDSDGNSTVDVTERYVLEDGHVIVQLDGTGAVQHEYMHGPEIDQVFADENSVGQVLYPLTDNVGTVRDVATHTLSTGVTTVPTGNHRTYDSFGNPLAAITDGHAYAYTGREFDADVNLQYSRARWFDASVGKFISEDPIGFQAGDANVTRYVFNNPNNATDPTGQSILSRAVRKVTGAIRDAGEWLGDTIGGDVGDFLTQSWNVTMDFVEDPIGMVSHIVSQVGHEISDAWDDTANFFEHQWENGNIQKAIMGVALVATGAWFVAPMIAGGGVAAGLSSIAANYSSVVIAAKGLSLAASAVNAYEGFSGNQIGDGSLNRYLSAAAMVTGGYAGGIKSVVTNGPNGPTLTSQWLATPGSVAQLGTGVISGYETATGNQIGDGTLSNIAFATHLGINVAPQAFDGDLTQFERAGSVLKVGSGIGAITSSNNDAFRTISILSSLHTATSDVLTTRNRVQTAQQERVAQQQAKQQIALAASQTSSARAATVPGRSLASMFADPHTSEPQLTATFSDARPAMASRSSMFAPTQSDPYGFYEPGTHGLYSGESTLDDGTQRMVDDYFLSPAPGTDFFSGFDDRPQFADALALYGDVETHAHSLIFGEDSLAAAVVGIEPGVSLEEQLMELEFGSRQAEYERQVKAELKLRAEAAALRREIDNYEVQRKKFHLQYANGDSAQARKFAEGKLSYYSGRKNTVQLDLQELTGEWYEGTAVSRGDTPDQAVSDAFFTGLGHGGVIVADSFTFGKIDSLNAYADHLVAENANLGYGYSRAAAVIGREAAIAAFSGGFSAATKARIAAGETISAARFYTQTAITGYEAYQVGEGAVAGYDAYQQGNYGTAVFYGVTTAIAGAGLKQDLGALHSVLKTHRPAGVMTLGGLPSLTRNAPTQSSLDWSIVSKKTGETRVQHVIAQHGSMDLQKPVQGIFYGDPISTLDDAWSIGQRLDVKPVRVGNVDIHVVPRPNSGYSGGFSGQLQNLDSVTIITQGGSNKLITGYPGNGLPLPKPST